MEFMQKVILLVLRFSIVWVSGSYILAALDKINPLENLGIGVVSTIIASVLAYAMQNCSRAKWFKDKTANKEGSTDE